MNRPLSWGAVVALVALGAWIVLAPKSSPHFERVVELQSQLSDSDLSRQQRDDLFRQMREEMGNLSEPEREQLRAQMREQFEERAQQEMDAFFALPETQRIAELDKHIDAMEARRRQFESRRRERSTGDNGPNMAMTQRGATSTDARPGGRSADGQSRGRGDWRSMSPEQRNQRRVAMLDRSTPKQRAQRSEYFRLLRERRKQRGLPEMSWPSWR